MGGWLRKAGNKAKLSPGSAGAWAELGNKILMEPNNFSGQKVSHQTWLGLNFREHFFVDQLFFLNKIVLIDILFVPKLCPYDLILHLLHHRFTLFILTLKRRVYLATNEDLRVLIRGLIKIEEPGTRLPGTMKPDQNVFL